MISFSSSERLSLAFDETPAPLAKAVDGDKVLLFVHGFSHNRRVWDRLIEALPGTHRTLSVDLRGHGASPWSPRGDYGLEALAADLPLLLDRLEVERVTLVGHSLGGNVATLFAASSRERVDSLVLVDTGPVLQETGVASVLGATDEFDRAYSSRAEHREVLAALHPGGDAAALDALSKGSLVERLDGRFELALDPALLGDAVGREPLAMAALEETLVEALRSLECPVLLVRGGRSSILSEGVAQRMTTEWIARGQRMTLPDAGHAVMIDDPAGLAKRIAAFTEWTEHSDPHFPATETRPESEAQERTQARGGARASAYVGRPALVAEGR